MKTEKNNILENIVFFGSLLIGAIAVIWMGLVFMRSHMLAFAITVIIGGVYSIGVMELLKFRSATSTLSTALGLAREKVPALDEWLDHLDPSLRNAVRVRIHGDHVGLPAPVLTPYLVGLLVMLGLLGTFVGMVDTLQGTVTALQSTADLQAIRDGLAAPIKGLGLAFGTSVAGVAASAMLGLMSTLSRRDRMLETRQLDTQIPIVFKAFSGAHTQEETFKALQVQTRALPAVAEKLDAIADKIETLSHTLTGNQNAFHETVKLNLSEFAASLDATHKHGIAENVRLTGEMIQPVVQKVMHGMAEETKEMHQLMTATAKENLSESHRLLTSKTEEVAELWKTGLAAHTHLSEELTDHIKKQMDRIHASSDALIQSRIRTEKAWLDEHKNQMGMLTDSLRTELGTLRDDEDRRGRAAVERLADLETTLASHLTTLGQGLEAPLAGLIQTIADIPRSTADAIEQFRAEVSKSIQRDRDLLKDQQHIMEELNLLSGSLKQASDRQGDAIGQLVDAAGHMLEQTGQRFSDHVETEMSRITDIGETFAAGAVEMAGLGDAFTTAVQLFSMSNEQLIEHLTKIEAALEKSTVRSDDQLAYYVAQAREIIDQCMLSQKEIFDTLNQVFPETNRKLEAC